MINLELIFSLILAFIFLYGFVEKYWQKNKIFNWLIILWIIVLGLYLRIYLASYSTGNYDMESYKIAADLVLSGKNIYAHTYRYNYSPLWAYVLAFFRIIELKYLIPLSFSIRFFLSLVDLGTLVILILLAKKSAVPLTRAAIFFFLNPISIILTGHHGQFDNLTIFFILLGAFIFLQYGKTKLSWLSFTLAGILKHHVFSEIIIGLRASIKKLSKVLTMFFISIMLFAISFLPYWQEAKQFIIGNVFYYRSTSGLSAYGVPSIFERLKLSPIVIIWYKNLFYAIYIIFPFLLPARRLLKNLLLVCLFFLVFAPGYASQYTILPIALGSLMGGPGFLFYTLLASFHLFGHGAELNLWRFQSFWDKEVWYAAIFWFIFEFSSQNRQFDKSDSLDYQKH